MVPPLSFSLVCRSWRMVVLSHPILWSEISIKNRIEIGKDYRDTITLRILKKWLIRSSSAPLRIHLNVDEDHLAYIPRHILPLFLQEIKRWSFVDIFVTSDKVFSTQKPTPFSLQCPTSLRSLSLKLFGNSSPAICVDLSHCISDDRSHLEHLSLGLNETIRLPNDRNTLRLPRLRSFFHIRYDEGKNLEDLRYILSAAHSLEKLQLGFFRKSVSSTTSTRGSTYLRNLTSLTLTLSNRFASRYILDILTCPSLRELSLSVKGTQDFEVEEDRAFLEPLRIRDLLVRSCPNPPLQTLRLDCMEVHEVGPNYSAALKDLLVALRNLKTLYLHIFSLNHAVLEMLTITTEELDSQLCPSLHEIHLAHKWPREESDISEESLEDMVVSRWEAGSLCAVTFRLPRSRLAAMKERKRMVECIREGLEITYQDVDQYYY
ncbi:hypothetical protein SCHPADRAFT_502951 [Schizopora paradoxa]|uniref:Uncharacterized protein n=1 Tax=Schizopora paradoxa TaxID=27342 RepID=A0A0H2RMV0_9AGAM|nr:hypothetical protein SCHPADRAFT_502951 [Schizopora paradoxa]